MALARLAFERIEWALGIGVTLLALLAWALSQNILERGLTLLQLFPVLGLIAFGLMWTHYISGALRRYFEVPKRTNTPYWTISSGLVLALIILHPLLFNIGLAADGVQPSPGAWFGLYGSLGWFVVLGLIALVIFLLFELKRFYGAKHWWKWVERAQILAMMAIFVHALALGQSLSEAWYMIIWWIYGISLILAVGYSYRYDKTRKQEG